MPSQSETFLRSQFSLSLSKALAILLNSKHLYQSVEIETEFFEKHIQDAGRIARSEASQRAPGIHFSGGTAKDYVEDAEHSAMATSRSLALMISTLPWRPKPVESDPPLPVHTDDPSLLFELPTIQTFCLQCEGRWPFNPGTNSNWGRLRPIAQTLSAPPHFPVTPRLPQAVRQKAVVRPAADLAQRFAAGLLQHSIKARQLFHLPYQCQQCKGSPVSFLVRRTGLKLSLVGRDPLETVELPDSLPKEHRKYFSDAIVAHNAGQTLAGLFLLRTFIEQYWLSLSLVPKSRGPRIAGDELGQAYNKTLPDDFKSRFPSLLEIFGKLSAALHSADANDDLFDSTSAEMKEHFDARRLFKLDARP